MLASGRHPGYCSPCWKARLKWNAGYPHQIYFTREEKLVRIESSDISSASENSSMFIQTNLISYALLVLLPIFKISLVASVLPVSFSILVSFLGVSTFSLLFSTRED